MKARARAARAGVALSLVGLCGCAGMFPATAEAIAPATFDDVWLGLLVDLESWWGFVGLIW